MTHARILLLMPPLLAAVACAPSKVAHPPETVAVPSPRQPEIPTPKPTTEPAVVSPLPEPMTSPAKTLHNAVPASSTAVLALLHEAETSTNSGHLDNAASTLERAIRLDSRNPELWQKLAEVRLRQHQPVLAEALAKKSNVLGNGDTDLIHKNWSTIAEARRQNGDADGAKEADLKAGR